MVTDLHSPPTTWPIAAVVPDVTEVNWLRTAAEGAAVEVWVAVNLVVPDGLLMPDIVATDARAFTGLGALVPLVQWRTRFRAAGTTSARAAQCWLSLMIRPIFPRLNCPGFAQQDRFNTFDGS
ncbi:hypothetical protein [Streptomyces sp. 769]|uniref:hypothetical protein n=1 Tax=Streptomyces sp. 769 TaxID=1262452 RepID=UPI00099BE117|nr:hypothetical protein [Streptomyces sp. 769]